MNPVQQWIAQDVLAEQGAVGHVVRHHPADMGMPEAADDAHRFIGGVEPANMWRVWIVARIAVRVMPPMTGRPVQHAALRGHRAERGQHDLHRARCFEGPVREAAVEPQFDSNAGQHVHTESRAISRTPIP